MSGSERTVARPRHPIAGEDPEVALPGEVAERGNDGFSQVSSGAFACWFIVSAVK